MEELQLKLAKNTNDGVFGKAISNLNKVLYSSGGGFYSLIIRAKRNSLVKLFESYKNASLIADEAKRTQVVSKYEKAYDNYINLLEKYIVEVVYNRVQKRIASLEENRVMSLYYEVNGLKGTDHDDYKNRKQILLLDMDWENVLSTKNENFTKKYKAFYLYNMEQLYKTSMRHYAVLLTDITSSNIDERYNKIYQLVENYIKLVLPYRDDLECKDRVLEIYKNFVLSIDNYSKKKSDEIKRKKVLLEISRELFAYSLPMIAAEQCFKELIEETRIALGNSFIDAEQYELYSLLLDLIESYHINILSQKVYWDTQTEKEEHKKLWDEFKSFEPLERIDFDEYKRKREILFVNYELKELKKSKKNYEDVRKYYIDRMKQLHALREFKNAPKHWTGRWKTRRRVKADE
ncbi:MAG: hypothetical protein IJ217_04675 [Clostridia bacterium]|nr:hypothetical protein [Clostridia bacterium]